MSKKNIKKWLHLVVDDSMSIRSYGLESKVRELIQSLIEQHAFDNLDNILEVTFFSSEINTKKVYEGLVSEAKNIKNKYFANGPSTAIISATYDVLDRIKMISSVYKDDIHVVMVLTDGKENSSKRPTWALSQLIKEVVHKDNSKVTLIFQCPSSSVKDISNLGVDRDNILPWEQTEEGLREVEFKTSGGLNAFYSNVNTKGITQSRSFYVQPDLQNVSKKQIEKKLVDISDKCGIFTSKKDIQIRDLVVEKTGKPYVKGKAYYQLKKTEKVQANKEILIFDKNCTELYGGKQARELIGLPDGFEAKVYPQQHENRYDIYIQSTSVNRKINSGDKIVIKND